jgi:toxin ParE1/3/4
MGRVRWSVRAFDDYQAIYHGIERTSPIYTEAFGERLHRAVEMLEDFPNLGRAIPEYNDESFRELIVGTYRVFYQVRDEDVLISAIWHASRSLLRGLPSAPWDLQ